MGFESDADGTAEEAAGPVDADTALSGSLQRRSGGNEGWRLDGTDEGCGCGERRQRPRRSSPETPEGPWDLAHSPGYAGVLSGGGYKLREVPDGLPRPRKDAVFRSLS